MALMGRADEALMWQQEVLVNRQRKRKRRPERAPEANAPIPYRGSSGALRTLQEVALGPDMDDPLPPRRRRRKPRALLDDDEDEEEENGEEPAADPHGRTGPMSVAPSLPQPFVLFGISQSLSFQIYLFWAYSTRIVQMRPAKIATSCH